MARERLTDKLLRLTEDNARLKADAEKWEAAYNNEKNNLMQYDKLLKEQTDRYSESRDEYWKLHDKYWKENKEAFDLELAFIKYHAYAAYNLWWLCRECGVNVDIKEIWLGKNESDRDIMIKHFPLSEMEENRAIWERWWKEKYGSDMPSITPVEDDLNDIWKSFKNFPNSIE